MKMFSSIRTIVFVLFFVASIGLNVATVASTAVAMAMSNVFEAAGFESAQTKVRNKQLKSKQAVRDISEKISKRTVKAAARNAGSVAAEAIPYVGIAAMLGVTTMDLIDACDTMNDMRELNEAFDLDVSTDEDTSAVCGYDVPKVETVLSGIKDGTEEAWKDAHDLVFELPDFSDAILSVQSGAEVAVNGTTTAFYVTLDRAQDGAVMVVSGTGNIVDAMLKQLGDGTDYMVLAAAEGFKKAMGHFVK